ISHDSAELHSGSLRTPSSVIVAPPVERAQIASVRASWPHAGLDVASASTPSSPRSDVLALMNEPPSPTGPGILLSEERRTPQAAPAPSCSELLHHDGA